MTVRPLKIPAMSVGLCVLLQLALLASAAGAGKNLKAAEKALPEPYKMWLEEVELLISAEEREAFLELEKDYQRDAFIERFWKIRDPYPDTARNEFRENWYERLAEAQILYESLNDDRARMLLLNGPPDSAFEVRCTQTLWPVDVWYYDGSERVKDEFFLVFYQHFGSGQFRLWRPLDGIKALAVTSVFSVQQLYRSVYMCRYGEDLLKVLQILLRRSGMDFEMLMARIERPTENPSGEWLATFEAYSTDVAEDAEQLKASLQVEYPGRNQNRTVVQATLSVATEDAGRADLADFHSFDFFLTGEVLREGELFENFRYKFDIPAGEILDGQIPLVFHRHLRPGTYTLIVKLEDLNSKRVFRSEGEITVPWVEGGVASTPGDAESARLLAEAEAAISSDKTTLQIVPPHGEMLTGMERFDTMTTGQNIDEVQFLLDDRVVLRKNRPPYSVELDLGQVPRTRVLRAVAYDSDHREVASDELTINAGSHRFSVRLVEPRRGKKYSESVQAEVAVEVPENRVVDRVELYLNETLVATLYQPPFSLPIRLPEHDMVAYVRAVAYLPDGNSTEDLVFINSPDFLEEIEVEFVELYTTVLDRQGRPVQDLGRENFTVFEDGVQQEIVRFERVQNLPIHACIMLDISASMDADLPEARAAALRFFEEAVTPKDRAALVTFNDHPQLAVKFTNELDSLAGGLAGLKAERGTALYDSVIFSLYYFSGIKGQRAILLLSDGKDENSRFTFEAALDYARRAGVAIYAIGLDLSGKSSVARKKLSDIADETGGRSFFIKEASELGSVYSTIQEELRSRFLIAYQSSNTSADDSFRTVDVKVSQSGLEAKTLRGYYP